MTDEKEIKPKFMAVRLDETQHWSDEIKSQVKAIYAHYLFDENQVTHCCEVTPSYWLRWVGFDIETEDPKAELPDVLYETIEHEFYAQGQENSGYYHCHVIDRIEDEHRKKVFMESADLDPWSEGYGYDNVFDEVHDAWNENPLF